MDPELLEKYRERLLTQQRQLVQRVLQLETELHNMEAERDIQANALRATISLTRHTPLCSHYILGIPPWA